MVGTKKEEKLPFLRNAIMKSYESLRTFIWLLADADVVDNETELIALKKKCLNWRSLSLTATDQTIIGAQRGSILILPKDMRF